jgi:L-alanine-DL-glutamate epimerase-like enolase superfamily enzyme
MKITDLEVLAVDARQDVPLLSEISLRPIGVHVRVLTDEGVDGVGAATATLGGRAVAAAAHELRPAVVGKDPLQRERLWHDLLELALHVFPPQALAAIDCALWDLAGKVSGLPVSHLLGAYRDRVPCYGSTPTYPTVDGYLQAADTCIALGFRALKLHPWGRPAEDIQLCRAVREHVGPQVALMLDALGAYDLPSAVRVGRALEELNFEWFEMPIRDQGLLAYQRLAETLDIPITSGEVHTYSFFEAANYVATGGWDFARIDASISGGITGAKKAAALCEGLGVRCELHSFGYPLTMAANLQVAAAVANCTYFEVPLPLGALDIGMTDKIYIDEHGDAHVPARPGLGLRVDWDEMSKFQLPLAQPSCAPGSGTEPS